MREQDYETLGGAESDNVVPLVDKKSAERKQKESENESLEKLMERNKKHSERLAEERKRANQWVLRSYRLKK